MPTHKYLTTIYVDVCADAGREDLVKEAVAVIGLVAAISQSADYGYGIVKRLEEFTSATNDVPESFRSLQTRLQLVIGALKRVQVQASAGRVSAATAQALKPVVESSQAHAEELTSLLDKAIPQANSSTFEKRLQALQSLAYDQKVQKILDQLQSGIQLLIFYQTTSHADTSDEIRHELSQLSRTSNMPPPNYAFGLDLGTAPQIEEGAFVGREAELRQLGEWLTPPGPTVVAVSAMGGMGKTQLSIAFARQSRAVFSSVFWINAKDEVSLKRDLVTLAQRVFEHTQPSSVGGPGDEDQLIEHVRRWFSRAGNDRWLLLFDNYDDPKISGVTSATGYDIRRYFPHRSQGSILITTRSRQLMYAKQLGLQKLEDVRQSVAILGQRSGRDLKHDPNAVELARRLDGLPLALATAGAYLGQSTSSVREYLDAYEEHWQDLSQNADEPLEYEDRTLCSTCSLSLTQIRGQDLDAAELLTLLAYFDNQDIWYELVQIGATHGLAWLTALTETKARFKRAMARLHNYSLVEITGASYSLHARVHDWTLQALNHEVSAQYYWLAVRCVASHVKQDSERDWEVNRRLVLHALRLGHPRFARVCDEEEELDEGKGDDLIYVGLLLKGQGKAKEAQQMLQRVLAGYEKALGPDHSSTLDTVSTLGNLYRDQGKMTEAKQMFQRALAGKEKSLGPDHPSTLDTVSNLGTLYRDQGKMAEAEQMFQRALAGEEKTLGPNHPSTLDTVNNLGNLYRDQGKMVEAEQMLQRALADKEKALGPDHPSTLDTANNLGNLYLNQSKLVKAEQMYQQALTGKEKVLGPDHPSTLNTVNNLGSLYLNQGRMVEAEQMCQRALTGTERALGPDHSSTLDAVNNLGIVYSGQGKMTEAEQMFQRALADKEKALGPDHPSTLDTVNNLGNLYHGQGKMVEAEQMLQRALAGKEKALGPDHPSTLDTVNNLGNLYHGQGKMVKAEQMFQQTLAGKEKALGPDHPSTLDTANNLGNLYRDQGKMVEAEQRFQQALTGKEKILGPDHPSTLNTANNLGLLYLDQGKTVEAEQMFHRTLAGKEKALGPDHPSTLDIVNNMGLLYLDQGKTVEAEQMFQRALAGKEKALGSDHPSTLNTATTLEKLHHKQGKAAEREQMYPQATSGQD